MLDPLSALGIVSNVVQLVTFTADVVQETRAFAQGDGPNVPSCEAIAQLVEKQLAAYNNICSVEATNGPLNRQEQTVKDLAEKCTTRSHELIRILEKFRVPTNPVEKQRLRFAFKKATKVVHARWNSPQIEQRRQHLADDQNQLLLALVSLIRQGQGKHFAELQHIIRSCSRVGHGRLLDAKHDIMAAIERQEHEYETSTKENLKVLTNLESSISESRDVLLASQQQNSQDILHEASDLRQKTAQIGDDVVDGFTKLDSDLQIIRKAFQSAEHQKRAQRILGSLQFPDMRLRHQTIAEAHSETFEWIFHDKSSPFKTWLSAPSGMFWVCGKAGSGKSTLMKFLVRDKRTRLHLGAWAGDTQLVVANFYFWYLGSQLQKSEEGLLRSILYQMLHARPKLIRSACQRRWEDDSEANETWSTAELRQTVANLASSKAAAAMLRGLPKQTRHDHGQDKALKFCFFVDGLDEYQADHLRLVELLQSLSKNTGIKICVSSRPWNVFNQAFGHLHEQLVLEDLTRPDITLYVRENLRSALVDQVDRASMEELANEVASKAQGVFLWVFLTVRSLNEGIAEGDTMSTLRERIAVLPTDLGDYFQLILSRVHPVYKKTKTMTALYLAMTAIRSEMQRTQAPQAPTRSFLNFWMLRQGIIDDPAFVVRQDSTELDAELCNEYGQRTRAFLSAICKDLMYLPRPGERQSGKYDTSSQVEFLHRTVYEFLDSDEMRDQVESGTMPHVRERHFNVSMKVARIYLEGFQNSEDFCKMVFTLIRNALEYDLDLATELGQALAVKLENLAVQMLPEYDYVEFHNDTISMVSNAFNTMFAHDRYLGAMKILKTFRQIHLQNRYQRILKGALGIGSISFVPKDRSCLVFLEYLLTLGVNFNATSEPGELSPWHQFLCKCDTYALESRVEGKEYDFHLVWRIAKLLIRHGASLHSNLPGKVPVEEALLRFAPLEYHEEIKQLYGRVTEPACATKKLVPQYS